MKLSTVGSHGRHFGFGTLPFIIQFGRLHDKIGAIFIKFFYHHAVKPYEFVFHHDLIGKRISLFRAIFERHGIFSGFVKARFLSLCALRSAKILKSSVWPYNINKAGIIGCL